VHNNNINDVDDDILSNNHLPILEMNSGNKFKKHYERASMFQ
jgi:hypothetical protein